MKNFLAYSLIVIVAVAIGLSGLSFYEKQQAAKDLSTLPHYCIGKIETKDTLPGFYSYRIQPAEDAHENAFRLITRNSYPLGNDVIVYPKDSIQDHR